MVAASTGSAATLGVLYTAVVSPRRPEPVVVAGGDSQAGSTSVATAVVLSAQDGSFERAAGAAEAPVCPSWTQSTGCVVVSRSSDIRMKLFGYTVSIPPVWVGRDGEDRYVPPDIQLYWLTNRQFSLDSWMAGDRRRTRRVALSAQSDGDNRGGGQDPGPAAIPETVGPSVAPGVPAPPLDAGVPATFETAPQLASQPDGWTLPPSPLFAPAAQSQDALVTDTAGSPYAPAAPASLLFSGPSAIDDSTPEPSTWLMTLAGFAALAVAKLWRTGRARLSRGWA